MRYKKHVFVCTNDRDDGRKSCGAVVGMILVEELKKQILDNQLQIEIRSQKAGCFDTCAFGPIVLVYPDNVYYGKVTVDDVKYIVESHLKNNIVIERLKINFPKHQIFGEEKLS